MKRKSFNLNNQNNDYNKVIMPQRKLRFFSMIFCFMLSFASLGVSVSVFEVKDEVNRITASWAPNTNDIGKLKFVTKNQLTEQEVMLTINQMQMPFDYSFIEQVDSKTFKVDGLGAILVKSCLPGTVDQIKEENGRKTIKVDHGKGLSSVYKNIDTVSVKKGDSIDKNTPLGVTNNSQIFLQILYKGKAIAGLTIKEGELTFI